MVKLSELSRTDDRPPEGQWYEFDDLVAVAEPADPDKFYICVAPQGNPVSMRWQRRFLARHRKVLRSGELPEELLDKQELETVARTLLVGWANLEDEEGGPIPYSAEKALELMNGEGVEDLIVAVLMAANREGGPEEDEKNSPTGSAGN